MRLNWQRRLRRRKLVLDRDSAGHVVAVFCPRRKDAESVLRELVALPMLNELDLQGSNVTDDGAAPLAKLATLRKLNVVNTRMTGAGLRHLVPLSLYELHCNPQKDADLGLMYVGKLKSLETLDLCYSSVDDAALLRLRGLENLKELDLLGAPLDGRAFRDLPSLKTLRSLNLEDTRLSDHGLGDLPMSDTLEKLFLDGTKITDASIPALKRFPNISVLGLSETSVSGEGLKHLVDLHKLGTLFLDKTSLTDKDVPTIAAMKNLKTVLLRDTKISPSAWLACARL